MYHRMPGCELTWDKKAINQVVGKFLHPLYNLVFLQCTSILEIRETSENVRETLIGAGFPMHRSHCREEVSQDIISAMVRDGMVIHQL